MNATNAPNSTGIPSTCQASPPDQLTAVSFSVSYGLVLVLAVIGNSLVINFARTNGKMKSNVFNLFLICMATADILDVLIVAPLHWIYFFFVNKWIGGVFGTISCKLLYFLVDVSIFVSVLALVAISFDRYFAVCYMNYTPLSRVKTLVIIAGIWAGSCLLSTFTLYKFQIVEFKGQSYCVAFWNNNDAEKEKLTVKYEMSIKFAVSYGIPLLLMIVLYALIIRELRRRLHSCVVEENQELKRQIAQQNRPLVEMFITLVTIFAICWFPVHVNHMLIAFDFQTYLCLPTAVPLVFYLLAHTNAAINPLLYFIFISGFRNELKRNAKAFWNWATKSRQESSHSTSTWLTFFKSRSPSVRRRKPHNYENQCNEKTAGRNSGPIPSTPEPFLRPLNVETAGSTNHGLSIEADNNLIGANVTIHGCPDPSPPLPIESSLGIERRDWARDRRHSNGSIRSSRSLNVASFVNSAFDTDSNYRHSKSASFPWKLSTFV